LRKYDPAEWGGTETAMLNLFQGLREAGVTPVVFCPRVNHEGPADPLSASGCALKRFRAFLPMAGLTELQRHQFTATGGNLMSFDLPGALRREPDLSVVHTHTLGRLGGIALTVARRRGLPFVVSIHGGVYDLPPELKNGLRWRSANIRSADIPVRSNVEREGRPWMSWSRSAYGRCCEQECPRSRRGWDWGKPFGLLVHSRRLFADADAILACNPREAELLQQAHPAKRVLVQPHGVPRSLYQADQRRAARAAFPQIEGRQVLLAVGRIDPVKNQAWLLEQAPELFRRQPKAMLVLAGACTDEAYGEFVREEIRRRSLGGQVLLTGGLSPGDARLVGLLQEARALVLPSVSETFGLVILEAWGAGTAVIASRTSGAATLLRHGQNGFLFDLANPAAFLEAVQAVLHQPGLREEMTAIGHKLVCAEYDCQVLAARMKRLYEQLSEEKHALRHSARR